MQRGEELFRRRRCSRATPTSWCFGARRWKSGLRSIFSNTAEAAFVLRDERVWKRRYTLFKWDWSKRCWFYSFFILGRRCKIHFCSWLWRDFSFWLMALLMEIILVVNISFEHMCLFQAGGVRASENDVSSHYFGGLLAALRGSWTCREEKKWPGTAASIWIEGQVYSGVIICLVIYFFSEKLQCCFCISFRFLPSEQGQVYFCRDIFIF